MFPTNPPFRQPVRMITQNIPAGTVAFALQTATISNMPTLWITVDAVTSRREIKGPLTAGSSLANALVLADSSAARHNLKIDCDSGGWYVMDIADRSNVEVNGTPIIKRYLEDGDEICVGDDTIVFHTNEPSPEVLKEYSDGVFPADFSEIPSIGYATERRLIRLSWEIKRARRTWAFISVMAVLGVLSFLSYVLWLRMTTDPLADFRPGEAKAASAMEYGNAGDYGAALDLGYEAMALPLLPETLGLLKPLLAQWGTANLKKCEVEAAQIDNAKEAMRRFPETSAAQRLAIAKAESSSALIAEKWREVAKEWRELDAQLTKSRSDYSWLRMAYRLRDFEVRRNGFPQAALANMKVKRLIQEWADFKRDFYFHVPSPRHIVSRMNTPLAAAIWTVESGEWTVNGSGMQLTAAELPPASLVASDHSYCAARFWMSVRLAGGPYGPVALGLRGDDRNFFRIAFDKKSVNVEWQVEGSGTANQLALPDSYVGYYEFALFEDSVTILANGSLLSMSCPGSSDVIGIPFIEAVSKGAIFEYVTFGR
ncbi:MAG: hypothetical protein Kow00107_01280 [Planctomycetota bacterium]